jgi:Fe-Mn family superoxide dismutase
LYRDHATGKLENLWVNEHDTGHLVLGAPILIMDVFEHAYLTQFGLEKARYIELFLQSIHWDVVHRRLECL